MLHRGEGIVLVTGPTGAGKTTTVYTMLRELEARNEPRNIVTIEDPVEFNVPFLRQMSVDEAHGITLSAGLRTTLRMDPDIVFVGEIRDAQTAEMAMRAASSGKYVFSTLHTRDVASTATALRDLGVSPRSLVSNLTGIISQRLVRRLCPNCRELGAISDNDREVFAEHDVEILSQVYRARRCDHCRSTGYRGRIGVFEVAVASDAIVEAIDQGATEDVLRRLIRSAGAPSLTSDGIRKVVDGLTTIEEIHQMRWICACVDNPFRADSQLQPNGRENQALGLIRRRTLRRWSPARLHLPPTRNQNKWPKRRRSATLCLAGNWRS